MNDYEHWEYRFGPGCPNDIRCPICERVYNVNDFHELTIDDIRYCLFCGNRLKPPKKE